MLPRRPFLFISILSIAGSRVLSAQVATLPRLRSAVGGRLRDAAGEGEAAGQPRAIFPFWHGTRPASHRARNGPRIRPSRYRASKYLGTRSTPLGGSCSPFRPGRSLEGAVAAQRARELLDGRGAGGAGRRGRAGAGRARAGAGRARARAGGRAGRGGGAAAGRGAGAGGRGGGGGGRAAAGAAAGSWRVGGGAGEARSGRARRARGEARAPRARRRGRRRARRAAGARRAGAAAGGED